VRNRAEFQHPHYSISENLKAFPPISQHIFGIDTNAFPTGRAVSLPARTIRRDLARIERTPAVHWFDLQTYIGLAAGLLLLLIDLFVFQPWRHKENRKDGIGFWLLFLIVPFDVLWLLIWSYQHFPNAPWLPLARDAALALAVVLGVAEAICMGTVAARQVHINRQVRRAQRAEEAREREEISAYLARRAAAKAAAAEQPEATS
jgi:hypothetical protein